MTAETRMDWALTAVGLHAAAWHQAEAPCLPADIHLRYLPLWKCDAWGPWAVLCVWN
jgi:hypothetical protein